MKSLPILAKKASCVPGRMAAAASIVLGIGTPEQKYKKASLWITAFRLGLHALAKGLAPKNKMVALKLFGGITLFFGFALRSMQATAEWKESGSIFTWILFFSWAGFMAMAASRGFEKAWEHFKRLF